jgi:type II secretory pathway component PulF
MKIKSMDPKLQEQLDEQEIKINQILDRVTKAEKYLRYTFWITIVVFVIPLVLMVFAVPAIISSYTEAMSSLDGLL